MGDSSEDEELDICNEKFKPLKALYSEKTIIPVPEAPQLDNLAKYEALMAQSEGNDRIDEVRLCYCLKKGYF